MKQYTPLEWTADSQLTADEQAHVERQRKSLWEHGIRRQPQLDRMAFEFGAVAAMMPGTDPTRPATKKGRRGQ